MAMSRGKIWGLLILIVVATGGLFLYQREFTFDLSKIHSELPYKAEWETSPLSAEQRQLVKKIVSQDLTYLGRGAQCYAFVTQDGEYVFKLFKHHHLRPTTVLDQLPMPQTWFASYRERKAQQRQQKQEHLFASCKLAYEDLSRETGLVYIQLNRGAPWTGTKIHIRDRFGKAHVLDLGNHEFMIQRRAIMAVDAINRLMNQKDTLGSQQCISQILCSLTDRCEKGIVDLDPAFNQNFGLAPEGAIQIDVGRFERNPLVRTQPFFTDEIKKISNQFRQWLEKKHPTLIQYFDSELTRIIKAKDDSSLISEDTMGGDRLTCDPDPDPGLTPVL